MVVPSPPGLRSITLGHHASSAATKRTVHFDRWLHYARSMCLRNKVEMFHVGTELVMADLFTKALDKTKFLKCRKYLLEAT